MFGPWDDDDDRDGIRDTDDYWDSDDGDISNDDSVAPGL